MWFGWATQNMPCIFHTTILPERVEIYITYVFLLLHNLIWSVQVKAAPKQRSQTLDSLFANMKEQRMRVLSKQQMPRGGQNAQRQGARQQQQQRFRGAVRATGTYRTNY